VDEDVQECEGLGGVGQWYLLARYQISRRPSGVPSTSKFHMSVDISRHMALSIGRWLHLHVDASSILRILFNQ